MFHYDKLNDLDKNISYEEDHLHFIIRACGDALFFFLQQKLAE
jgi:hypothetical protein